MTDNVTPTQADLIGRLKATPYNATDPEGALFLGAADVIATQAAENARLKLINFDYDVNFAAAEEEIARLKGLLRDIVQRSYDDPLGTSKVIDMRNIALSGEQEEGE